MIPAALIAALAITCLGAIHAAVFGGFAAQSLAQRIEAASPKAIMTASCGIEGKKVIPYRPLVEDALRLAGDGQQKKEDRQCKTFIWQRDQHRWNHPDKRGGQRNWQRVVKSARARGVRAAAVPVRSDEGVYIIYTSGESILLSYTLSPIRIYTLQSCHYGRIPTTIPSIPSILSIWTLSYPSIHIHVSFGHPPCPHYTVYSVYPDPKYIMKQASYS